MSTMERDLLLEQAPLMPMSAEQLTRIEAADIHKFAGHVIEQFGHLVLYADDAKQATTLNMLNGTNAAYFGDPGGGKTTLGTNAHRVIKGISDDNVARIPGESDLKPKQVIGGQSVIERTIDDKREVIVTEVDGLVKASTQVILADEFNREAPHAANATLEAAEERTMTNTAGKIELSELEFVHATLNPGTAAEGVFRMGGAQAGRYPIGIWMRTVQDIKRPLVRSGWGGWKKKPEAMRKVVDVQTLRAMRNFVQTKVDVPEDMMDYGTDMTIRAESVLRDYGIHEDVPRITGHARRNALGLAAMAGRRSVERGDIDTGLRYIVFARLGIRNSDPSTAIPRVLDDIGIPQ